MDDREVAANGLILRGNGALTCGGTPEQAVARMWLLGGLLGGAGGAGRLRRPASWLASGCGQATFRAIFQ